MDVVSLIFRKVAKCRPKLFKYEQQGLLRSLCYFRTGFSTYIPNILQN